MPQRFWDSTQNQLKFMHKLAAEMHITRASDWRNVRLVDIKNRGGAGLLSKYGNSLQRCMIHYN